MTSIEWTDVSWNPVRGCSVVSPGCTHCYAMKFAHRYSGPGRAFAGLTKLTKGGPVWTGDVRLVPEKLDEPLRWRKPRRVFVNSMSDLFHDGVPNFYLAAVFATMGAAARHSFQVLTKRPERMRAWAARWAEDYERRVLIDRAAIAYGSVLHDPGPVLRNVWLGVSVEDQARADERIPLLLDTPAAVRFLSVEPLLGPVDLKPFLWQQSRSTCRHETRRDLGIPALGWVIVGGESGPGGRPCKAAWIRSVVKQCKSAGVACFVKQMGARPNWHGTTADEWPVGAHLFPGYRVSLGDRKGGDPAEWPWDLRVREFPEARP